MPEGSTVPAWRWSTLIKALIVEYKSADGATHFRRVWLLPCPLLFTLCSGDDFFLQYDPSSPERIYIRESTQSFFRTVVGLSAGALLAAWVIQRRR